MKVVGLVSGGKDSCYNMMQCVAAGHTIVALANIEPSGKDELDSYMYQTVGHQGISKIAEAMGLPLFRRSTKGHALEKGRMYHQTENDEVEDLYELLEHVKSEIDIEGVAVGAILSDYQRIRVENVCSRLGLVSLAYLWRRDQTELLQEMIDCKVLAIVIKVAALGLEPSVLGRPLHALQPQLLRARDKFGLNVCGEGGEYETFTLDCPLFKSRIVVDETQVVLHSSDPIAPAGYMNLLKLHLEPKATDPDTSQLPFGIKTSLDFINDLNESSYSDLSDLELSENELVNCENIAKQRRQSLSESSVLNPLLNASSSINMSTTYSCPSVLVEDSLDGVCKNNSNDLEKTTQSPNNLCCKRLSMSNSGIDRQRHISLSSENESTLIEQNNGKKGHRKRTKSKCISMFMLSPITFEYESENIQDCGSIFRNQSGWSWIGGIVGEGAESDAAMKDAMNKLCTLLESEDLSLIDVCAVTLYVRNMNDYALFNATYVRVMNHPDPPARVCVECPLPEGVGVIMEALAHKWPPHMIEMEAYGKDRHTMHVQGISHWAPANIGPYSQAVRVGDIINLAGQIPLVPGSMTLAEGDGRVQCRLALRHVQRLLNAMDPSTQIRDVVQAVCYLTHPWLIAEARRQWERRTNNAIVDYVVVPSLPKSAPLEWHVWAHRHNSRFEYEETGCNIGEYKVALRRRWNYENNVAAAVCYVATGSSTSASQLALQTDESFTQHKVLASNLSKDEMTEILDYMIRKLLKDYQHEAVIGLRIFYKVTVSPPVTMLLEVLKKFRGEKLPNIAFTVVPVIHLQNVFTFLSISAVRHES